MRLSSSINDMIRKGLYGFFITGLNALGQIHLKVKG